MADKDESEGANEAVSRANGPGLGVSLVVSMVIGALTGPLFGLFVLDAKEPLRPEIAKPPSEQEAPADESGGEGRFPKDAVEIPLAPIVTTIGPDKKTNIRLELSLVAAHGTRQESVLNSEIREDVIAYLWGLKLGDLEGGRGFLNFRLELEERARVRSRGAVLGLLVGGVAVQ